jgi:uncharacterized delta-60 repeat protein
VAIQPDGKIVAAGFGEVGLYVADFALARYNRDGSLDRSFGSGGKLLTDFGNGSDSKAFDIAIEPDGKIVAAGQSSASGSYDFALARYNRDGSLDSSFGSGGRVLTDFGSFDEIQAVAIQPNGKIVAAGEGASQFALARYNRDGSLDQSFGSGGKILTDLGPSRFAWAVAIEPAGKIVAAGDGIAGQVFDVAHVDFALVRYNPDGSLDQSFGSGGKVLTDLDASYDTPLDVGIEPDGQIVAVGASHVGRYGDEDFALARYNRDGSLDSSFGSRGKVLTDIADGSSDEAWAVAIGPAGKIVAAGIGGLPPETGSFDFALARYNRDGSLDQSFGSGGKMLTDLGQGAQYLFDAAIAPNGKIVAAGDSGGAFKLVRYLAR